MDEIRLSRWEEDEYIVEINGNPIGGTVTKANGEMIISWLKNSYRDIRKVK